MHRDHESPTQNKPVITAAPDPCCNILFIPNLLETAIIHIYVFIYMYNLQQVVEKKIIKKTNRL